MGPGHHGGQQQDQQQIGLQPNLNSRLNDVAQDQIAQPLENDAGGAPWPNNESASGNAQSE